jgi:hypothetical protein
MSITSLDDLQPGDFMLCGQSSAPAKLAVYGGQFLLHEYFRVGRFIAGHAGIITPGGKLVEAMPHGARERDLREDDWSESHAYFRLLEDYPGQALDASFVAQAMVGIDYSIASYAYLAAYIGGYDSHWLERRIDRRQPNSFLHLPSGRESLLGLPVEAICSVLAEQSWTITGKRVILGTAPQVVTPGMLGVQLWNRPGTIRGGKNLPLIRTL